MKNLTERGIRYDEFESHPALARSMRVNGHPDALVCSRDSMVFAILISDAAQYRYVDENIGEDGWYWMGI